MPADPLADLPPGPRQPFTPAALAQRDPDRPVLEVTTEAPGLLVIADTWMPGWSARSTAMPVPILRGNHAQRHPPGPSGPACRPARVRPTRLCLGSAISALTTLAWGAYTLVAVSRRRLGGASADGAAPSLPRWVDVGDLPNLGRVTGDVSGKGSDHWTATELIGRK